MRFFDFSDASVYVWAGGFLQSWALVRLLPVLPPCFQLFSAILTSNLHLTTYFVYFELETGRHNPHSQDFQARNFGGASYVDPRQGNGSSCMPYIYRGLAHPLHQGAHHTAADEVRNLASTEADARAASSALACHCADRPRAGYARFACH